jgi:3-deoxy-D-manno-octulosonic-acid transferase
MGSFRFRVYRTGLRFLFRTFRKVPPSAVLDPKQIGSVAVGPEPVTVWFHGSSVGEVEALLPILEDWLRKESKHRAILSVFSPSGGALLEKLKTSLKEELSSGRLVAGFSPDEGDWLAVLRQGALRAFVTYRYEAWPDLWGALAACGIPLWVVAARMRPSLKWIFRWLRLLGLPVPPLVTWVQVPRELKPIQAAGEGHFAGIPGRIQIASDPRWDRVEARRLQGNRRAQTVTRSIEQQAFKGAGGSGVLGNVWPQDVFAVQSLLQSGALEGGLFWVVPHRLESSVLAAFQEVFREHGVRWVRSSEITEEIMPLWQLQGQSQGQGPGPGRPNRSVVWVDEFGFLAELYGSADWAYVGGGFGKSVHSLLEPAVHGIPIFCGPAGLERFPESTVLAERGQLNVLSAPERLASAVEAWVRRDPLQLRGEKAAFRRMIETEDLGGSQRIVEGLMSI